MAARRPARQGAGWQVDRVVDWLLREGRLSADPLRLIDALAAWAYVWMRGRETRIERIPAGVRQTAAYLGSPAERMVETDAPVRFRLDRLAPADHRLLHELAAEGGTDYALLPLRFSDGSRNVFALTTDAARGFSAHDLRSFETLSHALSPVLEVAATHRLAETLPTPQLLAMLNEYFETVAAAVSARGGEILRFVGDAMLVVFSADAEKGVELACKAAVDAALDAFARLAAINLRRREAGDPEIRFGVGLTAGEVVYGNVGAPDRLDFTVIGPSVNRGARLESLTKELGIPILMTAPFAGCLGRPVRSLGMHRMKGLEEPIEVWALEEPPS